MSNQEIYLNAKSWPFIEAQKILKKINGKTPAKGYVLFETGYGPSGLPHIGTFGEVVRTSFVRHAFELLAPEIPTRMFCISDDIDGLRKVPENIPNQELITANLGKPLTSVPDPFETHSSYGDNMNARLRAFLDRFGFKYEFISATEKYKSGAFDSTMLRVLEKYDDLMDLMLKNLGEERRATYSPFMPIDAESGKVIDKGVKGINKEKGTVIYEDENGVEKEVPVTGGNCKLQWKVDFGARWYGLQVDYEIYGKDHLPNEKIYRRICEILGETPPVNYFYEMFLSADGAKISKSKGNGISVEDWLKYAPEESLSLYMFQKPKTAKRLYFDVIPKAMDEYLAFLASYAKEEDQIKKADNPVFHIHQGDIILEECCTGGSPLFGENQSPQTTLNSSVPKPECNLTYSLLLNLASACNPENDEVLWGFISNYQAGLTKENSPNLAKMVACAINYYNDFIKAHKEYRNATDAEKSAILDLKTALTKIDKNLGAMEIQTLVFEIGKNHGYEKNMRDWFSALYQILLGQNQGPRMGSFIALYGIDGFIKMVDEKVK
ncbi:MAG: lysyl-tRNA synthetase class 1 [Rickettsiales bacterium]|jgi:lysyl-tRNA synthetase class 1